MDISYYKKYEPIFGYWKIVREIGSGSFGKVFEIEREDFGYTYKAALKAITIPQDPTEAERLMDDSMDEQNVTKYYRGFVQELVDEFQLMSKLKGESNIVSYEDHIVVPHEDGIGWDILIRMELLTPLTRYAKEHPISQTDAAKLGIDICKALEICRRHGIIHRDIKPDNIFVSERGNFKLGDFGIARTAEKTMSNLSKKGTYNYMAPEVYNGSDYGPSVDIYSLGIVLYRYLNNNRFPFLPQPPEPFSHNDLTAALARRSKGEALPSPVNAGEKLAAAVLKACAFDPKERFRSATEMREALESALAGLGEERKPAVTEAPKAAVEDEETVSLFGGMPDDGETVLMTAAEAPAGEEVTVPADATVADEDETVSVIGGIPPIYDEPTQADTKRSEPKTVEKANKPVKTEKRLNPKLLIAAAATVVLIVVAVIAFGGNDDPAPDVTDALPSPASTDEAVENSSTSTPTDNSSSGKKNNSSGKRPSGSSSEKWGEWSEWGSEEIDPSDNVEVETRTVYTYNLYRYRLYNPLHSNYPDSGFKSTYEWDDLMINSVACARRILKLERGYSDEETDKAVTPLYAYIRGRGSYEDAVNALASYDLTLAYETKTVTVAEKPEFKDNSGSQIATIDGETWFSATGEPDGTEVQYRSRTKS
mgnify:CR=1 FL=1